MGDHYEVKSSTPGSDTFYVESEDLDSHAIETAVNTAVGTLAPATAGHVATRPEKTYVYRKMSPAEFKKVMDKKKMQYPLASSVQQPNKGEQWFTESMRHSQGFQNAGAAGGLPDEVAEFELGKQGYQSDVKDTAIHQVGSKKQQPTTGKPYNVFNRERLRDHPQGKVNIGLKGRDNVDLFNDHIISVKKIDPHSFTNKSTVLRWMRRNKLATSAFYIGVAVDAATLTLSVIEDGGEFGANSIITTANIVGGAVGTAIGSALGSIFPGIGTTILGFVGGMIGSLVGDGIARLCLYFGITTTAQGPGAPPLDTDPSDTNFGPPALDTDPRDGAFGTPGLGLDTGATGAPGLGLDTGATGAPGGHWNQYQ